MTGRGGDGVALSQPSVPASDRSAELTRYPDDMLTSPLDVRVAHTKFTLTAEPSSASQPPLPARPANILDRSRDELAALIATPELSLTVIIFSLLVGATLMGIPGMLLAIPVAALVQGLYLDFWFQASEPSGLGLR